MSSFPYFTCAGFAVASFGDAVAVDAVVEHHILCPYSFRCHVCSSYRDYYMHLYRHTGNKLEIWKFDRLFDVSSFVPIFLFVHLYRPDGIVIDSMALRSH